MNISKIITASLIGCGLFAFAISAFAEDSDDPASELASFQMADGFEINLFASETNGLVKPIQIRFDARGRLWIIGSSAYPQIAPGEKPNDKVLILEDTDHDGRADKTTVFADGLMIPTGIELGNGGAYLGHGTELLFLKDTNGDDKADERRVVFRGFGTGDNHQNINSFAWGPGGELWMSQGLHARSNVETLWGIVRLNQAGLWRLWPKRQKLEAFYGSAHEPQNPWGFVFTDWGEPIVLAGNNSSTIYPVPGLVVNHRDDPPPLIWKNGHGRKVSGGEIVGTAHFPDAWQGALIEGGYINNAVWALKINDDGAGFVLEDLPPLVKSTHRSFRPVDVKFGPDGALYICDWYNPIIGHYQASFRDPARDKKHGRIWRVTAKGRPLTKPPQLVSATPEQLLNYLKSPDRWTRHFAKRVLADLPTSEVLPALKQWTTQPDLSEHDLKEALGVYQSHEIIAADLLSKLCRATNSGARAYAASVVGAWVDRLPDPLALLRPLVADENPCVRLQAIVACTYIPKSEAMETAVIAADFPSDKFITYALNQAVFALKPFWLEPFKSGKLNLENKPARLKFLIQSDGTSDTLQVVRDSLKSPRLDSTTRETFLRALIDTGEPNDFAAVLKLTDADLQARLLPALTTAVRLRNARPNVDLSALLKPLVENNKNEIRSEALKLAGLWKVETLRAVAEKFSSSAAENEKIRRAAIEALAGFADDASRKTLSRLARENTSVQSAAIIALCSLDATNAAQIFSETVSNVNDEAALTEIFSAFFQRQTSAEILAQVFSKRPPPKLAAEVGLRLMNASGRRHEGLARILTEAAGLNLQNQRMTPAEIATFGGEVRTRGDAKHGAEIFRRAELGCTVCHAVNGQGGNLGPDLSALGSAQPVEFILGAILDPQKEIKEGFLSISITTKDGEEYQGYLVRETADEFILRDVLQNKEVRLRHEAIQENKQNGSVMPAGLADTLTRPEFRDLVRFLSELGQTK